MEVLLLLHCSSSVPGQAQQQQQKMPSPKTCSNSQKSRVCEQLLLCNTCTLAYVSPHLLRCCRRRCNGDGDGVSGSVLLLLFRPHNCDSKQQSAAHWPSNSR